MKNIKRVNPAIHLRSIASDYPDKKAFIHSPTGKKGFKNYKYITFGEFEALSNRYANVFFQNGIRKGTKTIVMVKSGPDVYCIIYALFKVGAIPVLIDPGMGIGRMLHCLGSTGAEAFIGMPAAHLVRIFTSRFFNTVKIKLTVGSRFYRKGNILKTMIKKVSDQFDIINTKGDDLAAISFTTGSTGPAKGVEITYGMLEAMIESFKEHFSFSEKDIDLVTLPLLAVMDAAIGATAVLAPMNPSKPAQANADKIIDAINIHGVNSMFGSPALLNRVARYGELNNCSLPTLRRIISGGAPVSPAIINRFRKLLNPEAKILVAYGATEALPISSIDSNDMLDNHSKSNEWGTCIGNSVQSLGVKIIKITDDIITKWSDDLELHNGEIGEIIISGDLVSPGYYQLPDENALNKIKIDGKLWHRTGDCGCLDDKERIWFCGRKKQRVNTTNGPIFTVPCEMIFNSHNDVFRSALVRIPEGENSKPAICIELEPLSRSHNLDVIKSDLEYLAQSFSFSENISTFLFHKSFPVDIRHNAKINREELAVWAQNELQKS